MRYLIGLIYFAVLLMVIMVLMIRKMLISIKEDKNKLNISGWIFFSFVNLLLVVFSIYLITSSPFTNLSDFI